MAIKPLSITPAEIDGRYHVEVSIQPSAEQDQMQRMQIAQMLRAPGPDGRPHASERDIYRFIWKDAHPEEMVARAEMQALAAADKEILDIKANALRYRWRKENEDLIADAEKEMNPDPDAEFEKLKRTLTPETFKQIIESAKEAARMEMMGQDPAQMAAQIAADQEIPETVRPMQQLPGQVAGPAPETMPSQMMGTMTEAPQPMQATPEVIAMQARRGRPLP